MERYIQMSDEHFVFTEHWSLQRHVLDIFTFCMAWQSTVGAI